MKIVGAMVVGANEKRLKEAIDNIKWVDTLYICDNGAGLNIPGAVIHKDSREWGRAQYKIKQDFFDNIIKPNLEAGDWIIWKDADEIFYNFDRTDAEKLAERGGAGFNFYVVNLIDDGYSKKQSFWNVRMWQYRPELHNVWQRRNLHCGNYPLDIYRRANFAPYLLIHYGLKDAENRNRKVERYKKYDPDNRWMRMNDSYYRFLEKPDVSELDLEKLDQEVRVFCATTYFKEINQEIMKEENMHYFRRISDDLLFAVPEGQVHEHKMMKKAGEPMFLYIGPVEEIKSATYRETEAPVVEFNPYGNNKIGGGEPDKVSTGDERNLGDIRHQDKPTGQTKRTGKKTNKRNAPKNKS